MEDTTTKVRPQRYCFDISGIVDFLENHHEYTGIQRVVAMAASGFYAVMPEENKSDVYVGFHDRITGRYKCASFAKVENVIEHADLLSEVLPIRSKYSATKKYIIPFLDKYKSNMVKYYFHLWRLDALAFFKQDANFLKMNTDSKGWKQIRGGQPEAVKSKAKIDLTDFSKIFEANDVLFLLDAAWQTSHANIIKKIYSKGIKTLTMVHDLVPLKVIGYTDPSIPGGFTNWLLNTNTHTTAYLAISNNTHNDLREFLSSISVEKDIHNVPLVQSFNHIKREDSALGALSEKLSKEVYPDFSEVITLDKSIRKYLHTPFILCVGTIEIRKNPLRLIQAWKQLIKRSNGDIPKLVFAGRMGWLVDDFKAALEASGNLFGYVDVILLPTDQELSFLYRNCLFAMMPSLYEGWGLPVGEALSLGKTAVVSHSSSLSEVGRDLVKYCDPTSVSSIEEAVWQLFSEPQHRIDLENRIKLTKLRSWHDVGTDLCEIAKKV